MRGVTQTFSIAMRTDKFLLTRLMRGVTCRPHNPRCGDKFLLTRLMRGVTAPSPPSPRRPQFLLTRLMRGVTGREHPDFKPEIISTHTPHARRDARGAGVSVRLSNFYSHASCEA